MSSSEQIRQCVERIRGYVFPNSIADTCLPILEELMEIAEDVEDLEHWEPGEETDDAED